MELLKLAVIFALMAIALKFKLPLYLAVLGATVSAVLLFGLSLPIFFQTALHAAVSWQTLSVLLTFYMITYLQRMLERRDCLALAQQSLDGIFNNRRVAVSLVPAFLGLLPSASVSSICGAIVDKGAGDTIPVEDKAFVASFFRHMPESFLPTFPSVVIALSLVGSTVTMNGFIAAMTPMVCVAILLGYLLYLRKIPKETGQPHSENKTMHLTDLFKGFWPIALIVILILSFSVPVYFATLVSIGLFIYVGRFSLRELGTFVKHAFEAKLLLSSFFIMIFKDVLGVTGVISALPEIFSALPIPNIFIYALIFFTGTLVSGTQATVALGIPIAFAANPEAGLPLLVLLMGVTWAASQLSPTHVCLSVVAEYYKIGLGKLIQKTIPVVMTYCIILFGYYFVLAAFCK